MVTKKKINYLWKKVRFILKDENKNFPLVEGIITKTINDEEFEIKWKVKTNNDEILTILNKKTALKVQFFLILKFLQSL